MYIFVWERVQKATNSYHPEGGLAVVAANLDRAKVIACENGVRFGDEDDDPIGYALAGIHPEAVYIFPDSGCC